MARRAPQGEIARTATLTVRLTPDERLLIDQRAAAAGVTPSAYAAKVLTDVPVVIEQRETMHPAVFQELSRIGNNINQLAHGMNTGFPPSAKSVLEAMKSLFEHMMRDELTRRRLVAAEQAVAPNRTPANGSEAPRARHEFQGRVSVSAPR